MTQIMAAAITAGLAIAWQLPASAAPGAATPTISIGAKSALPKVTGDVLVVYRSGTTFETAAISGDAANVTAGEVIRLFGQRFPYKKAPVQVGSPVSVTGVTQHYSISVTPSLATKYQAEVFADGTSTTPLAVSAIQVVYVAAKTTYFGLRRCGRPTCHETVLIRTTVPPPTLRTEMAKRWFAYFGIRFSPTGTLRPRFLKRGGGGAHFGTTRKVSARVYQVKLTLSFFIGNHGYFFQFNTCQPDSEAKDGLNLPGHHGCGTLKVISSKRIYLG